MKWTALAKTCETDNRQSAEWWRRSGENAVERYRLSMIYTPGVVVYQSLENGTCIGHDNARR